MSEVSLCESCTQSPLSLVFVYSETVPAIQSALVFCDAVKIQL